MSLIEIETPDTRNRIGVQTESGAGVSPHADPDAQTWSDTHPRRGAGPAISSTPPDTRSCPCNDLNRVAGGVALSPTTVSGKPSMPSDDTAQVVGQAGGAADAKPVPEGVSPLTPATSSCPPPIVQTCTNKGSAAGHTLAEGLAVKHTTPPAFSPVPPVLEGGTAIEGEIPDNYTPFPLEIDLLTLRMWAATYDAASRNKMATDARFRELTNLQQHLPGAEDQQRYAKQQKDHARKMLFAAYQRAFPTIYAWAVNVPGLATSSDLAWLLALTGDPRVKQPYIRLEAEPAGHVCCEKCGPGKHLVALEETPRKVSELWSYCGHGAAIKRRKGMTAAEALAGGNTMAKTLAHRLAEACMKMPGGTTKTGTVRKRSPYRDVYDAVRLKVEVREDWTDGHKHNHAVRLTAKAILKDLWLVQHGLTPTYGATS